MPSSSQSSTSLKQIRINRYLAKDYDAWKAYALERARLYYSDSIQDFSDPGFGGMIVDLMAVIGDNLNFYLDHQFGELDSSTAVESANQQKLLNSSGVKIVGASPATVSVTWYFKVPADSSSGTSIPNVSAMPVVKAGSTVTSNSGITFVLVNDLDFTTTDMSGNYLAQYKIDPETQTSTGQPTNYLVSRNATCVSGQEVTETFNIGGTFVPFNTMTLSNPNVSTIMSVVDGFGNTYYEVANLTDDVVFTAVPNMSYDSDLVPSTLVIAPAPYRFITSVDLNSRTTTLTFGGGQDLSTNTAVLADPSDFALPLPFNNTFTVTALNPSSMLNTTTLGVAATGTTYAITYFCGGGLDHNVSAGSINSAKNVVLYFPHNPDPVIAARVRSSMEVGNLTSASDGEDAPTVDELLSMIPASRNSQERTVTVQDVLARAYKMPSNLGRSFRVAVRSNPNNPLAAMLFVISRDSDNYLITSSDTLKKNLSTYVNQYRLISDAIDVMDCLVTDLTFTFQIVVNPNMNKNTVLQNILSNLQKYFSVKNFYIDQPISLTDLRNQLLVQGVIGIDSFQFKGINGTVQNRTYSDVTFDADSHTMKDALYPPPGGIFEVKYPDYDIIGKAV